MITHVVLLTLQDPDDAPEACERIRAMAGRIEGLESIEAGVNISGGDHHLALLSRHTDRDALAHYATSPAHLELLDWLKPRLAGRAFADWEA